MKKYLLTLMAAMLVSSTALAEYNPFAHRSYVTISTGEQSLNKEGNTTYKSDLNVGLVLNFASAKLHRKPVHKIFQASLDFGFDFNFARYSETIGDDYQKGQSLAAGLASFDVSGDWNLLQGDLGLSVGPSFIIAPIPRYKDLYMQVYGHFVPSYTLLALDDEVKGAFNPFYNFGFAISWRFVGLGYEYEAGSAKFKNFDVGNSASTESKFKYKTTCNRFYIKFTF